MTFMFSLKLVTHKIMPSQHDNNANVAAEKPTEHSALCGDILDTIFTRVPLIHLVPASHVSLTWRRSVCSSLRFLNPIKPWLLIHHIHHRAHNDYLLSSHAYDPRSHLWLWIKPDPKPISHAVIRCSNSNFLYAISSSEFSFSSGPLHLNWLRVDPPKVYRVDPVVARVGSFVVVGGGGYDFEDDPMAVEMYDVERKAWCDGCESMPSMLKSSASASWLSVAADETRLLVTEKSSGATFAFNPISKTWAGPFALRPDPRIYFCSTGFVGGRLIVIGLIGDAENCEGVSVWEFDSELMENRGVGNMPEEMVERLKGESFELNSVSAVMGGDRIFMQSGGVVVMCEFDRDGGVGWNFVENRGVVNGATRIVQSCSMVKMVDLEEAILMKKCKFTDCPVK